MQHITMATTGISQTPPDLHEELSQNNRGQPADTTSTTENDESSSSSPPPMMIITVGRLVEVASRTWPGINRPGGVARVTRVYYDHHSEGESATNTGTNTTNSHADTEQQPTHVDVSYMVGRSREKRVPVEYVTLAPQYETNMVVAAPPNNNNNNNSNSNVAMMTTSTATTTSENLPTMTRKGTGLRDRSLLLGRCRRCGSLRTDCGSCDWATEEEEQQQQQQQQQSTTTTVASRHSSKTAHHHQNHHRRRRSSKPATDNDHDDNNEYHGLYDSSSSSGESSDDDDDDDVALQDLLRTSRKQYRRHLRNRRKWNSLYEPSSLSVINEKNTMNNADHDDDVEEKNHSEDTMQGKSQSTTPKSQEEADDDDDDEDLEDLWQKKYRRHVRQRAKWQRRLETVLVEQYPGKQQQQHPEEQQSSSSSSNKRHRGRGNRRSVLETLDPNETQQEQQEGPKTTHRHAKKKKKQKNKQSQDQRSRRVTMDEAQAMRSTEEESDQGDIDTTVPVHTPQRVGRSNRPSHEIHVDESPIGVAESSSPEPSVEDRGPSFPLDEVDDDDSSMDATMDFQQRPVSSYSDDVNAEYSMDDNFPGMPDDDPDNIFIQPEGREAAENLPDDMVDRTKSIPYVELPSFFNTTAKELEDRVVPDFCLRLAEIQRQYRRLSCPRRLGSTDNNQSSASELSQQCNQCWAEITRLVIRNGTDQCRAALRRLSDDRIFRKHRKNLTTQERKEIRGATIMDARNLRLDALEDSVETLVQNLKNVTIALDALQSEENLDFVDDYDDDDDDDDGSPTGLLASSDEDYETQDLIPLNRALTDDSGSGTLDPSERPLGEFDPHQHATRRRTNKRGHEDTRRKAGSRHDKSARPGEKAQKRVKTSSTRKDDLNDFIVADGSSKRRPSTQSTHISRSSVVGGARSSTAIRTKDSSASGSNQVPAMMYHDDGADEVSSSDDDEETDDAPLFDMFDTEASQDIGPSSAVPTTSGRRPQRAAARQRRPARNPSVSLLDYHEEASTQRDRVPIARRMQEFLDKNNELNWDDADDAGTVRNPSLSRVDMRERLAQRRNGITTRQHVGENRGSQSERNSSKRSNETAGPRLPSTSGGSGRAQGRAIAHPSSGPISTDYLLSKFDSSASTSTCTASHLRLVPNPGVSAQSLLSQIRQSYPDDPVRTNRLLHQAQSVLPVEADADATVQIRNTASDLLQAHGTRTLIELIACHSPQLGAHVQLLSILVRNGGDTVLQGRREQFIALLLLQLVDAVYALIHPTGWSVKIPNRIRALELLEPIRDALAEAIPINEAVSRCIVEQLGCQEWRVGTSGDFIYVSSLDSSMWNQFINSGKYYVPQVESRYQKLGKVWPRVEVETAWNVLIFFGSPKTREDQTNQTRWQLITKLFSSSALAKPAEEESSNLPPNPLQLSAFESDVSKFVRLLGKGALDALPGTDKLVANLIKKGINLQAEDYLGNEESRFRAFPAFKSENNSTKFVARLWKCTQSLLMLDSSSVEEHWQTVYDVKFQPLKENQTALKLTNLLLPTSRLLSGCLSLLVAWAQRVPKKKVRQIRFLKQLKTLRESLTMQEKELAKQFLGKSTTDAFADAFSDGQHIEIGDSSKRMSLFFCEASAQLRLFESILKDSDGCANLDTAPRTKCLSLQTLKELWGSLACDGLREARQSLIDNCAGPELCLDDPLKVFVAGKIMAAAAFLCMDISPWCLTAVHPRKRLSLDVNEHNGMIEYYSFPISCVLTCVNYLSRNNKNAALLCHLYSIVTVLCNQLTLLVKLNGINPSLNRVAAEASSVYMSVLLGCFRRHVDARDDDTSHSLLRLILCAIRSISTFLGAQRQKKASTNKANESPENVMSKANEDEFFDDLDDDIFCLIQNGAGQSESPRVTTVGAEPYWKCMEEVLILLKPSKRFKVSSSLDREETLNVSPHGKYILNKDIDMVCDCLVAMAVAERSSDSLLKELVPLMYPYSQRDSEDTEYEMKIAKRLSTEICLVSSEYKGCQAFVGQNMELFLNGIIQTLLDPDRLGVFPSCHFEMIRNVGGGSAAREALAALDIFNGEMPSRPLDMSVENFESILGAQNRRRVRVESPWQLIGSFGAAILNQFELLATTVKDMDGDLTSSYEQTLGAACLEKESFACFTFLRNILSALSRSDVPKFEKIAAHLLSFMSTEVLRIVQGLRYFDQTNSGDSDASTPGRTKLVSLFHVFSEIFVATAAWILRETPASTTHEWKPIQKQLCESLFYPLLRRQNFDMTLNLKLIIESCQSVAGSVSVSSLQASGIPGCVAYFDPFFDMALRRCRQLTVAPVQSSVLQNYLFEGICSAEAGNEILMANLVGTCFRPTEPTGLVLSPQGPLQEELDRYLFFVESVLPRANLKIDMAEKRLETIRAVIIPKLAQRKAALDVKRKILRVSNHIFASRDAFVDAYTEFDMCELVATFVRPLRLSLFQCMKSKSVDDDLVSIVFACTANLARLLMPNPSSEEETVLCHIDDAVSQLDTCDLAILCQIELRALYLSAFFRWMYTLGSKIAREDDSTNSLHSLSSFRQLCGKERLDHPDESVLSDLILSRSDDDAPSKLEIWTKTLICVEEKLFGSKAENAKPVLNVYAKTVPTTAMGDGIEGEAALEPWKPVTGVTRSAKEYMTAILSMSS